MSSMNEAVWKSGLRAVSPEGNARDEIVEIAKDLVALWESPKIQGLPRADRNTAIEETRNKMIAAVAALSRC